METDILGQLFRAWECHNNLWPENDCDLIFIANTDIIVAKFKEFGKAFGSAAEALKQFNEWFADSDHGL